MMTPRICCGRLQLSNSQHALQPSASSHFTCAPALPTSPAHPSPGAAHAPVSVCAPLSTPSPPAHLDGVLQLRLVAVDVAHAAVVCGPGDVVAAGRHVPERPRRAHVVEHTGPVPPGVAHVAWWWCGSNTAQVKGCWGATGWTRRCVAQRAGMPLRPGPACTPVGPPALGSSPAQKC